MIKHIIIPTAIIAGSCAAALLAVKPYNARKILTHRVLKQKYIAHRGLFKNPAIPENSLKAFSEAVKKGYGIELDVQLTRDDRLVVFHDNRLERICGDRRNLRDFSLKELRRFTLCGTDEKIPLFTQVLKLVDSKVPIVVEIKPGGHFWRAARLTSEVLKGYSGSYVVESFNPLVLFYFRLKQPGVIRGQLSSDLKKDGDTHPRFIQFILSNMLLNFLSKPDFISYNHKHTDRLAFKLCAKLFNSLNAAWTIQNKDELSKAKGVFEIFIFDSFLP